MKNSNANIRIAGFTLAGILGVIGLGFIPPFNLFGMEFVRIDILSELRAEKQAVEEFHAPDF